MISGLLARVVPFLRRFCQNWPCYLGGGWLVLLLIQPASLAQSLGTGEVPPPPNLGWISDRADLIPWPTEQHLTRRINILAGRTSAELAIVTLPQRPVGPSAHEFALDLFNTWGIGQRDRNNGILLLVSYGDRRIEIITGTGLRQLFPDAEVSHLIQQEILPAFQRQDYATGITQGTRAIAQRLEARLPRTIVPRWMPEVMVWVPWGIAVGGAGLAMVGNVQAIAFSLTRVNVPVPIQGIDTQTFARSSAPLATDPFPRLLAKLFTPHERDWEQEIPGRSLSYVWIGGVLMGVGLIQGFWQFVLMHPEAEIWQKDAAAWGICAVASGAWLLWGAAVSHRFVTGERFWQILLLGLGMVVGIALLGGVIWVYQVPTWPKLLVVTGCWDGVGWIVWRIGVGDDLKFKRQRQYCGDRSGHPIQELNAEELQEVLTPDETLAQSMGILEFRGWRDATLTPPLSRAQVYLVRRSDPLARACRHCQSFAVEPSVRTVERTIETTKKISRKQKTKITSVIQVQQTVDTCHSCGGITAYDQRDGAARGGRGAGGYSSSDANSGGTSSSSDASSDASSGASYNATSHYDSTDYGSSSSSGFGGGSSDGGGAGGDW